MPGEMPDVYLAGVMVSCLFLSYIPFTHATCPVWVEKDRRNDEMYIGIP